MSDKPLKAEVPDQLTIELSKPVKMGSGSEETVFTEIPLQEPNTAQLSQFVKRTQKDNAVDSMKFLISAVSGVPPTVLDKIGVRDFYKAQNYLIHFITPPEEDDPAGNVEGSQ